MKLNQRQILLILLGVLLPLQAGLYWDAVAEHVVKLSYIPILGLWFFGRKKNKIKQTQISKVAIALILWSTISSILAIDINRSLFEVSRYIIVLLMYLYMANYCDDQKLIIMLLVGLGIGLVFEDLIALYQNHYGQSIGWDFLGEGSGKLWSWRAIGTLRFPNPFGTYLLFLLPVNLSLLFVPFKKNIKILLGLLMALTSIVLIFTYSRSAWIGFAFSTVIFLLLFFKRGLINPKFMRILFPVTIVLMLFFMKYSDKMVTRWNFRGSGGKGIEHRYITARVANKLMKEKFLFGVGLRNFFLHAAGGTVHTTYLRIGAETGVPSLIMFLLIVFFIYKEGFKVMKSRNILLSRLAIGIMCSYSGFLITLISGVL